MISTAIEDLAIHPNPTTDRIWIENASGSLDLVEIWSADGRLVLTQGIPATRASLDVSALPAGTYHMRAFAVNGTLSRSRFVKN